MTNNYLKYLQTLTKPFKKLAKIEFLQPDNSVAFALDNNYKRGYRTRYDTRAFIQSGSLSVSLNNGQRRRANITLSNLDGAFDYTVNNIWFGQKIRLLMGLELFDGKEFYLPQGVFYINNPSMAYKFNQRTTTYNLVDKWSYIDGTLFGNLSGSYQIEKDDTNGSLWTAIRNTLKLDRNTFTTTDNKMMQIDNVEPIFTTFYDNKTGNEVRPNIPYPIIIGGDNSTVANILTELNNIIVGWIGYDQTGALRVDASQNDIEDNLKPVVWNFTPKNSQLLGISEVIKNSEVCNEVIVTGQNLNKTNIFGKVTNFDPRSDTNVNLIGRRTYKESQPNYTKVEQCLNLAKFRLKRKTILQKSITVESSQMFHLVENNLITVMRTDKQGSPTEKHLINSFTLPIGETGQMTINCTSVNDLPDLITETETGTE